MDATRPWGFNFSLNAWSISYQHLSLFIPTPETLSVFPSVPSECWWWAFQYMDQWTSEIIPQWDVSFYYIHVYIWGPDDQYSTWLLQTCTICCTEWRFRLYLLKQVHHSPPRPIQNITKNANVNNTVVFNLRQKWEGERWRQELLHLHTLYQCLCTCSGILHRFDYTTPAFFLENLSKHTAGFISIAELCCR